MKIGKKRLCCLHLLLCTATMAWIKRDGKQIEPLVLRAYRNMHLSKGIVCTWEIGKILWHAILNNMQLCFVNSQELSLGLVPQETDLPQRRDITSSREGNSNYG